jgi:hypothetical protein
MIMIKTPSEFVSFQNAGGQHDRQRMNAQQGYIRKMPIRD